MANVAATKLGLLLALILPLPASALQCGDHNGDCSVTATDALQLLRHAVGLNPPLLCECGSLCEFPASTPSGADCFQNADCLDPARPYCDANECAACVQDDDCPEGQVCHHGLERCISTCALD
jgi:hypothetical protein